MTKTAAVPATIDTDDLKMYVQLYEKKTKLDTESKATAAKLSTVADRLKDQFIKAEVQNVAAHGRTLFIHRQQFAGPADGVTKPQLMKALRRAGKNWAYLVQLDLNASRFLARVKECETDSLSGKVKLPPTLEPLITTGEVFSIRSRKLQK